MHQAHSMLTCESAAACHACLAPPCCAVKLSYGFIAVRTARLSIEATYANCHIWRLLAYSHCHMTQRSQVSGTCAVDNVVNLRQVFDVFFAVARNATLLRAISPNATQGQIYLDTVRLLASFFWNPFALVPTACSARTMSSVKWCVPVGL